MISKDQVQEIITKYSEPGKILAGKTFVSIEPCVEGDLEGNITTYNENIVYFGDLSVSAEDTEQPCYSGIAMELTPQGHPCIFVGNTWRPTEGNSMVNYISKPFRQAVLELHIQPCEAYPDGLEVSKNSTCHFVGWKVTFE